MSTSESLGKKGEKGTVVIQCLVCVSVRVYRFFFNIINRRKNTWLSKRGNET
jgi:hypothetical protein